MRFNKKILYAWKRVSSNQTSGARYYTSSSSYPADLYRCKMQITIEIPYLVAPPANVAE